MVTLKESLDPKDRANDFFVANFPSLSFERAFSFKKLCVFSYHQSENCLLQKTI